GRGVTRLRVGRRSRGQLGAVRRRARDPPGCVARIAKVSRRPDKMQPKRDAAPQPRAQMRPASQPSQASGTSTMTSDFPEFAAHLAALKAIAADIAAPSAADVDANSRFPRDTVQALQKAKLLSAPVPKDLGGAGYRMRALAALCSTLGQACGSSAMVLAMHYIQVACIARHGLQSAFFRRYLQDLVR